MASILCLAHYCDTHGPTPLMVTEGFAVTCPSCHDEDDHKYERRPSTSYMPTKKPDGPEDTRQSFIRAKSSSSDKENDTEKTTQWNTPRLEGAASTLETPPEGPRLVALSTGRKSRRDSSFRKTYDENDRKRAIPCENCALTLPKKVKEQIPEGAPGSPLKSGKGDNGSPILRTRKAYERISTRADDASAKSVPSDSDDSERDPTTSRRTLKRTPTTSSISSFASSNSHTHTHYLEYTSTHDPLSSSTFSVLRASCLRTLSCETLPPAAAPTTPTSPTSHSPWKPSSFHQPGTISSTTSSGGPIFFGDPLAGYTTAYIFRVPDPYARGRRRVYAFIHLSSSRERAAMRAFAFLASAFRDLAAWILALAEAEADRLDAALTPGSSGSSLDASQNHTPTGSSSMKTYGAAQAAHIVLTRKNSDTTSDSTSAKEREKKLVFTPTSAFLSGRPYDPDGIPRKGLMGIIRNRGLAELVGRPDFFIELHARFVRLLAELGVLLGKG